MDMPQPLLLQHNGEGDAVGGVRRKGESAAVEVDDLTREGKAYARTVALGREKWCEDILHNILCYWAAVVAHIDDNLLVAI